MKELTWATQDLYDHFATHLKTVHNVALYEDPEDGDEGPIWAVFETETHLVTIKAPFDDLDDIEELKDWINDPKTIAEVNAKID